MFFFFIFLPTGRRAHCVIVSRSDVLRNAHSCSRRRKSAGPGCGAPTPTPRPRRSRRRRRWPAKCWPAALSCRPSALRCAPNRSVAFHFRTTTTGTTSPLPLFSCRTFQLTCIRINRTIDRSPIWLATSPRCVSICTPVDFHSSTSFRRKLANQVNEPAPRMDCSARWL